MHLIISTQQISTFPDDRMSVDNVSVDGEVPVARATEAEELVNGNYNFKIEYFSIKIIQKYL